jgi:hypothetical protein
LPVCCQALAALCADPIDGFLQLAADRMKDRMLFTFIKRASGFRQKRLFQTVSAHFRLIPEHHFQKHEMRNPALSGVFPHPFFLPSLARFWIFSFFCQDQRAAVILERQQRYRKIASRNVRAVTTM